MFSFRHDKVGFFFGLALLIICGGTFIATLVLLIVGAIQGDIKMFLWPIRWVLMGWWIGCIVTVLLRVYILNWQMQERRKGLPEPASIPVAPVIVANVLPLSPEAEIARARAEQARYRAIGAIGVATVLGVVTAAVIISYLAVGMQDRPGAWPVTIVAWSVGGGVIIFVVLACMISMRRRDPRFSIRLPELPPSGGQLPESSS
jgi:hypothetical protein